MDIVYHFPLAIIVEQVIDELAIMASLGSFTVALSLVARTSGSIAWHCNC
jgi:hypothetical protein